MHPRFLQATTLLSAASLLVSGCTNIKNDQTRTKTEGALAGGVLGVIAGGLIGAATGGGGRSIVTGAVAGGAVGTAGGYAYGSHVAKKKTGYAANEARLRQLIGEARSERRSAEAYNASLRRAIAQQRADLQRIRAGRGSKADATRLSRNIDGNLSQSRAQYARKDEVAGEVRSTLAQAEPGANKQQLQAEYSSLQQEKEVLGQQIKQMNGMKSQLATANP